MTTMRSFLPRPRLLGLVMVLAVLTGCQTSPQAPTQLVVLIDGERPVTTQLTAVRTQIYDADAKRVVDEKRFELDPHGHGQGAFSLPLSFAVVKNRDPQLVLVISGYASEANEVRIETKVRVSFQEGQTRLLPIRLSNACWGQVCAHESTCYSAPLNGIAAGECGPILEQVTSPVEPGREVDFRWPPETSSDDTGQDAGRDAQSEPPGTDSDAEVKLPEAPPARSGYIVFIGSEVGGPRELFGVRVDDGVPQPPVKISTPLGSDSVFFFQAQGQMLSYSMGALNGGYGPNAMFWVDLSLGLPATPVLIARSPGNDRSVNSVAGISPSGRHLSYSIRRDGSHDCHDLFVMDLPASKDSIPRQISELNPGERSAHWSQAHWSGEHLIYLLQESCVSREGSGLSYQMRDVSSYTSATKALTGPPGDVGRYRGGDFSPDGSHLLYTSETDAGVTLFEVSGLPEHPSPPKPILFENFKPDGWLPLSYSPDQKHIVFSSPNSEDREKRAVYLLERDKTTARARRVSADLGPSTLWTHIDDWSPDSSKLLYGEIGERDDLFVVDFSAGAPSPARWLTQELADDARAWNWEWSRDSKSVFVQVSTSLDTPRMELFSIPITIEGVGKWRRVHPELPEGSSLSAFSLSPSGKYLFYTVSQAVSEDTYASDLFIVPIAQLGQDTARRLTTSEAPNRGSYVAGAFIGDDEFVLRAEQEQAAGSVQLWLETLDGSAAPRLIATLSDQSLGGATWLPDPPRTAAN